SWRRAPSAMSTSSTARRPMSRSPPPSSGPGRSRPTSRTREETMFLYYIDLAIRSFKRNKVLTTLMVIAVALGVGASMTTLTVLYLLSGDPIPGKSHKLYYVQLDPRSLDGY